MHRLLLLALLLFPLPAFAPGGPSFDCGKARTATEKLICSDADVSARDRRLAGILWELRKANPRNSQALIEDQKIWLSGRDAQCAKGGVECLKRVYGERIDTLRSNAFVVCGQRKADAPSFDWSCETLNDPLHLSVDIIGRTESNTSTARARIATLGIARSGAPPQTLPVRDAEIYYSSIPREAFELTDINFDGYSDIKLMTATSAGPNGGYTYWLYDPKAARFAPCKACDELSGFDIVPDPKKKTIFVNARSSCCSWGFTTYAWRGAALKVIESGDSGTLALEHPPFKGADLTACGTETDRYDTQDRMVSARFALEACEDPEDKSADLLAFARAHRRGFRLTVKNSNDFTIAYDPPLGHTKER